MTRLTIAAAGLLVPLLISQVTAAPKPAAPPALPAPPRVDQKPPDFAKLINDAVERSLPLVQKSAVTFMTNRTCAACHHQLMSMMVVGTAREYGFRVNEAQAKQVAGDVESQLARMTDLLRRAQTDPRAERQIDMLMVDPGATAGYITAAMRASSYPRNETAALLAQYVGKKQAENGRWPVTVGRPPQEGSEFTSTALAIAALKAYAAPEQADAPQRIAKGRDWLISTKPKTTEDRAFRLMGLAWSGAAAEKIDEAVQGLLDDQKDNGGWAQIEGRAPDAYATGLVLVALRESGRFPLNESAYSRGIAYLVMSQKDDGSWWVPSRSTPVQPYFDSGFPHGKDQFISMAGTCWANMALAPVAQAMRAPAAEARAATR